MIISEHQARLVARYLRDRHEAPANSTVDPVTPEVVERAIETAVSAPDPRPDRVKEAREWLDAGAPDPYALADKLLSRIMCDRVR